MDRKLRFDLQATEHQLFDLNMGLVQELIRALLGVL